MNEKKTVSEPREYVREAHTKTKQKILSSSIEFLKQVEASLFNRHTFVYI